MSKKENQKINAIDDFDIKSYSLGLIEGFKILTETNGKLFLFLFYIDLYFILPFVDLIEILSISIPIK